MSSIGIYSLKNNKFFEKIIRKISRTIESFKPIHKRLIVIEPHFTFCSDILRVKDNCYLSGVWQSEKYFKDMENIIRKEFTLREDVTKKTEDWINKIETTHSVSIHIRRGDYISNKKTIQKHGVCPIEYYTKAVQFVSGKLQDPKFFVFSDDVEWAKNNLVINYQTYFVSDINIPDYEEIIIMSKCKHNIIANSSFSWWGAWLNENKNKIVIAPKKWFSSNYTDTKDLIPQNWIRL
jgi:hypothetical protein